MDSIDWTNLAIIFGIPIITGFVIGFIYGLWWGIAAAIVIFLFIGVIHRTG